jgi:hypothetical protein
MMSRSLSHHIYKDRVMPSPIGYNAKQNILKKREMVENESQIQKLLYK